MNWNFVGLDLGQSQDFTAVTVVERAELMGDWDPVVLAWKKVVKLRLRYLERMPLGTPYPEVVDRVARLTRCPELAGQCSLIVDGTGVGRPVIDLLRRGGLSCSLMPVIITGGDVESQENEYYRVSKKDLISGVQVLLQREELQIASKMELAAVLEQELADVRVKITAGGREQYGAWREGQHDDLVLAVALACWGAEQRYRKPPAGTTEGYWTHPYHR
jgi:hypothetical protein